MKTIFTLLMITFALSKTCDDLVDNCAVYNENNCCVKCENDYLLSDNMCISCLKTSCKSCNGLAVCSSCFGKAQGDACNKCIPEDYMMIYEGIVLCINCTYSPCGKCNGTDICVECPVKELKGSSCDICEDISMFARNRDCYECQTSPCDEEYGCDGTDSCKCPLNENCCLKNKGSFYNEETNTCDRCIVPYCGTCNLKEGIECTRCLTGYILADSRTCVPCNEICGNYSKCDGGAQCTSCRYGLSGEHCDTCSTTDQYLISYVTDRVCISCESSPCLECNGTGSCVSCPEGITGDRCNHCPDSNSFLSDRKCISCSESPCGETGTCDGSDVCTCGFDYCCGNYDRYFYDLVTHMCTKCTIGDCLKCDSFSSINCNQCISGYQPNENAIQSCNVTSSFSMNFIMSFVWYAYILLII